MRGRMLEGERACILYVACILRKGIAQGRDPVDTEADS
jgi:hypothetical protein